MKSTLEFEVGGLVCIQVSVPGRGVLICHAYGEDGAVEQATSQLSSLPTT